MSMIFYATEDRLSDAIAQRLVKTALPNHQLHSISPTQGGVTGLVAKMKSYVKTSGSVSVLVVIDQDHSECAPAKRNTFLRQCMVSGLPNNLVFSVASHETEAWLLGDSESLATFLGVEQRLFPSQPETVQDPKGFLVRLASSGHLNEELCPEQSMTSKVGPGYNRLLTKYTLDDWRPSVAASLCPSLARVLKRLVSLQR